LANSPADVLEMLLLNDQFFTDEMPDCPVSVEDRKALLTLGLPWPSLKLIVSLAVRDEPATGSDLRTMVRETGQVDFLRSELDRRFFARSRSLKLLSTVAKAWEPCRLAEIRLRNKRKDVGDLLVNSDGLLSVLDDRIQSGDDDLADVLRYVKTTQEALRREHRSLTSVLKLVSAESSALKAIYEDFTGDLAGLEWLGTEPSQKLPDSLRSSLGRIFGRDGVTAIERAPTPRDEDESRVDAIETVLEELGDWCNRCKGEARRVLDHAAQRLEQLADHFETIEQEFAS